jgi:hypothetical protein
LVNRRHQKHKPMMHSWQALTCFAPQNGHEAGKKSDSFISSHFKSFLDSKCTYMPVIIFIHFPATGYRLKILLPGHRMPNRLTMGSA